ASMSGQPQKGVVPGDQTTGQPATDPSAAIVSQIEGQDQTSAASKTSPLESGWVTVGNTAMQRQNGSASTAADGSCPAGSNCSNTQSLSNASSTASPEGNPMPQMVAERRKDISDKQKKEKKDPHELASYDPYKNQGFNLTQQSRQPVNSMVERPIRVECYQDRIVFPKQPGIRTTQTVMLNQQSDKVNEQLLRQVALCVKAWGVAGRNMYWTPWIRVQTAADAGQSTTLLQNFFTPQGIAVRPDAAGELR
ncbi:MAG: hypothetical protein Q4G59_11115, partial [Planctomycetia bacterium]|nr:hypothetical protein [Planctomycetia bacterium]